MLKYIVDNAKWCINRQYFVQLLGQGMSVQQLDNNLHELCVRYRTCPESNSIEVNATRFALNDIALVPAKHSCQYQLQGLMPTYWSMFVAVSKRIGGVKFPSNNGVRLDAVVQLYMRATQNHNASWLWIRYKNMATMLLNLTARELAYIDDVLLLYRCKYYCAVCRNIMQMHSFRYMSRLTVGMPLLGSMVDNNSYSTTSYNGSIQTVVDCFGSSRVVSGANKMDSSISIDVSANGRNVLDTFCQHLYGDEMSLFRTVTNNMHANMNYKVIDRCEVRTIDIVAKGQGKQRYTLNAHCTIEKFAGCTVDSFVINNCNCVSVSGNKNYYMAHVLVDNKYNILPHDVAVNNGNGLDIHLSFSSVLTNSQHMLVHVVSIYGDSIRDITNQLDSIVTIGYCDMLPFSCHKVEGAQYDIATSVSPASNMYVADKGTSTTKLHSYTYQFGDNGVSTLLDNNGNSCTMLDGFVFGTEKISYYSANKITPINCGKFAINANGFDYRHRVGDRNIELKIEHRHAKVYSANIDRGG